MIERIKSICIKEDYCLKNLMKRIDRTGNDFFIVTDNNKRILGVITEGDIRRGILNGATVNDTAATVMKKNPVTVKQGEEDQLLSLFRTKNVVGKIPLVDAENKVIDLALDHPSGMVRMFNQEQDIPHRSNGKVLVIGGAGFIGSVLVRKLLQRNYKVKVLDALLYGKDSIKDLIKDKNFEFIQGDTRHIETLTAAMNDVSSVIHLAELVGDPACAQDAKKTRDINLFATSLVGQVCKQFMINRFIYVSSASVYGANKGKELLNEKSVTDPLSLYAKMKLESEKALFMMSDDAFSPIILRLSTVYGLSHRPRFDLVINTLTANAYHEGALTVNGGDQWRPLVHVTDVGEAIILALEAPLKKVRGQIFNVGSEDQNMQLQVMARKVKTILPGTKVIMNPGAKDKRDYKVCFSKIRNVLGFRAKRDVNDGIREIVKAFDTKKIKDYKDPMYCNDTPK